MDGFSRDIQADADRLDMGGPSLPTPPAPCRPTYRSSRVRTPNVALVLSTHGKHAHAWHPDVRQCSARPRSHERGMRFAGPAATHTGAVGAAWSARSGTFKDDWGKQLVKCCDLRSYRIATAPSESIRLNELH